MQTIHQSYLINAPVARVWQALVDPKEIDKWGAGPVDMDEKVGFEFHLWGGDIYGSNIEVKSKQKLVQNWYSGDWETPSKVTISLASKGSKTQVDVLQESFPPNEKEELEMGWKEFYFGPMIEYLEGK